MFEFIQQWSRRRRWLTGMAAIVLAGLLVWGSLHPVHRPDTGLISAAVREELGKTGFTATQGIHSAAFEINESFDGQNGIWNTEQKIQARDLLLTEKWVERKTHGLRQQVSGLYVGPLVVVRHSRQWLPIFGDLLPYHFWQSSHMTRFTIEKMENFPLRKGGLLIAVVEYEDRYATGEIARTESRRLRCDVLDVVQAASISPRLAGAAAKLTCTEFTGTATQISDNYTHWYVLDRAWSISVEGETAMELAGQRLLSNWKARLLAFD